MKIIVASKNPVKIRAAESAFKKMFPETDVFVEGVNVESGVGDQPMSDDETLQGAINRVTNARKAYPNADYWFGMEGGVQHLDNVMYCQAWIVAADKDQISKSRTATCLVPLQIAGLINQGVEMGHASDKVFGSVNSKHKEGLVGLLTADIIDRDLYYEQAAVFALVPFKNKELF